MKKAILSLCLIIFLGLLANAQSTTQVIYTVPIKNNEAIDTDWRYENIESSYREKWLVKLFEDIKKGTTPTYNDIECKTHQTVSEFKQVTEETDTLLVINPETNEEETQIATRITSPMDITHIKFMENWTWDTKANITKKVISYCPMVAVFDNSSGEIIGRKQLFCVKQE